MTSERIPIFAPRGDYCGEVIQRGSFPEGSLIETRFSQPTLVPRHRHEYPHVLLVLRGAFRVSTSSRHHELAPGDAIFHGPEEIHEGRVLFKAGSGFTIELTGHPHLAPLTRGAHRYQKASPVPGALAQIYRELGIEDLGQRFAIEGLILQIVATLMRDEVIGSTRPPHWLTRAIELLQDTPCEKHTMAELRELLGVPEKEILRGFRKYLLCTPAEYQCQQRLEIARKSLTRRNVSIATIAAETGFCDQAYFSKEFKRVMRCSPGQYRRLFQDPRHHDRPA